jgi:hypothetical protein
MGSGNKGHPGGTIYGVGHPSLTAENAEARISARNPGFLFFRFRKSFRDRKVRIQANDGDVIALKQFGCG